MASNVSLPMPNQDFDPAMVDQSSSSECSSPSGSQSSDNLELSYESSTFEGSENSDDEVAVLPFMYEPLVSSSSDSDGEEDSDDSGDPDPRLMNLNWYGLIQMCVTS